MSNQQPESAPSPGSGRSPFVTGLLVTIGIALLLPGLCSLLFSVVWLRGMLFDAVYHPGDFDGVARLIMFACAGIGAVGGGLVVFAIPRRNPWATALLLLFAICRHRSPPAVQ